MMEKLATTGTSAMTSGVVIDRTAVFLHLIRMYSGHTPLMQAMKRAVYVYYMTFGDLPYREERPRALEFAGDAPTVMADLFTLQPQEAIDYLKAKGYKITFSWRDMQAEAHRRAFTLAKVTAMDVLRDVRGMLGKALTDGDALRTFQKNITPRLAAKGWMGRKQVQLPDGRTTTTNITPSRLETIYRTNLQSSYNAGRMKKMQENALERPYLQYLAVMDSATTTLCHGLHGKVYLASHRFWLRFTPPNHHQCRATARSLSARQLAREGLKVEDDITPLTTVEVMENAGFESSPALEEWTPDLGKYDADMAMLLQKTLREPSVEERREQEKALSAENMKLLLDGREGFKDTLEYAELRSCMRVVEGRNLRLGDTTPEEVAMMRAYTGNSYRTINKVLRDAAGNPTGPFVRIRQAVNAALDRVPKHVDEDPLIRHVRVSDLGQMMSEYQKGTVHTWHAFTSTTTSKTANVVSSANVKFRIAHNGKGVSVKSISQFPNENEVLLPAGTQVRVTGVRKTVTGVTISVEVL